MLQTALRRLRTPSSKNHWQVCLHATSCRPRFALMDARFPPAVHPSNAYCRTGCTAIAGCAEPLQHEWTPRKRIAVRNAPSSTASSPPNEQKLPPTQKSVAETRRNAQCHLVGCTILAKRTALHRQMNDTEARCNTQAPYASLPPEHTDVAEARCSARCCASAPSPTAKPTDPPNTCRNLKNGTRFRFSCTKPPSKRFMA